jgi:RNA polymerase sigma factor (sigma-70 family)
MPDMTDRKLLDRWVQSASQQAFGELVTRHVGWVYAAALRMVRNRELADDVSQAVFIVLAKKAQRIGRGVSLSGWLFNVTRFTSLQALRRERRRTLHERRAAMARAESDPSSQAPDPNWEQVGTMVESLVAKLSSGDRQVVLLRFYQGMTTVQIGEALGVSTEAAKKRVTRAVQRLRTLFARKGMSMSAAGLGGALASDAAAAPAALAGTIMLAVTANSATSAMGLANGVINSMAWAKAKVGMLVVLAVIGTGVGVRALSARSKNFAPAPPQAVALPASRPSDPRFTATLRSGISVEVLGVTDGSATPTQWWTPDGAPTEPIALPADPFPGQANGSPLTHRLPIRIRNVQDVSLMDWATSPVVPREVRFDDFKNSEIVIMKISLPPGAPRKLAFGVAFGSGRYEVVGRMRGDQNGGMDASLDKPVLFGPIHQRDGLPTIHIGHYYRGDWITPFAILINGETVTAYSDVECDPTDPFLPDWPAEPPQQVTRWVFRRTFPYPLREIELRRQVLGQAIQFREISLESGARTEVQTLLRE